MNHESRMRDADKNGEAPYCEGASGAEVGGLQVKHE
jgi:hypothetical protein